MQRLPRLCEWSSGALFQMKVETRVETRTCGTFCGLVKTRFSSNSNGKSLKGGRQGVA